MVFAGLAALGLLGAGAVALAAGTLLCLGLSGPALPPGVLVPAVFAFEALLVIPAWVWGPRKYEGGWASLGLRACSLARAIALVLLGFSIILLVNGAWELVRQRLGWAGQPDYLPVFGGGARGLVVALLLGGVVAPTAEELFFRGYLYAGLRHRWGVVAAVAASSVLFSLAHAVPGVLPPIFIMGAVFALMYEYADSLWPCIALHSAVNTVAFVAAYLVEHSPGSG